MQLADVEEIYSKNKELNKEDIKTLQEWAQKQPHLPKLTELEFQLFLHSCFYHIELAKTTVDNFCTYRAHSPEFSANLDLNGTGLKTAIDISYYFPDHVKLFDMIMMQSLHQEGPSDGFVIIVDMIGFTFSHLIKLHVFTMKKMLTYLQEALPVRLKGIYVFNAGSIMEAVMTLVKPFLKKEVAECFYFFEANNENMFDLVPKECFPLDYGGTQESIAVLNGMMRKRLYENQAFFFETEKLIADESKRPGKPKNFEDVYGVEGSFKKLDID